MASFSKYALPLPPPSVRASKDTAGSLDPGFSSHTTKVCLSSGAATLKICGTLLMASAATSPTETAMSSYWTPRSTVPLLPAWTLSSSCWKLLLDLTDAGHVFILLVTPTKTYTPGGQGWNSSLVLTALLRPVPAHSGNLGNGECSSAATTGRAVRACVCSL